MISISVRASVRGRIWPSTIRRRAQRLLDALGESDSELSILLTDDEEIHDLNRQWRQKDKPTDVLSFSLLEGGMVAPPPGAPRPLGDVIISLDTAGRQVAEGCLPRLWPALGHAEGGEAPAWSLLDEITFLLIHGTLHLLGHDHMEPDEAEIMQALEARHLPGLIGR